MKKAKALLVLDSFSAHIDAPFTLLASEYKVLTVVSGVLYLTKTLVVKTSYIAIIALVLLRECSPLTTVDLKP